MQKNATGSNLAHSEHKNPKNTAMQVAMEEARAAGARGEVPIGAVIIHQNHIIARAGNRTREINDPTAHAEILAIRMACERLDNERLGDCDLYVTLEPCAMCTAAISFARIRRLYYAVSDPKGGGVEYGPRFYNQPTCHHAPDVYSGIGESDARALLQDFFKQKRK